MSSKEEVSTNQHGLKVAFLCPDAFSVWRFYGGLLKRLKALGCRVHIICAHGEEVALFLNEGFVHEPLMLNRFVNPLADIRTLLELYRLFRTERFDVVHMGRSPRGLRGSGGSSERSKDLGSPTLRRPALAAESCRG